MIPEYSMIFQFLSHLAALLSITGLSRIFVYKSQSVCSKGFETVF